MDEDAMGRLRSRGRWLVADSDGQERPAEGDQGHDARFLDRRPRDYRIWSRQHRVSLCSQGPAAASVAPDRRRYFHRHRRRP
ncbi:MAG: hypothetical protein ACK55I_50670, partial [bacterium]